MTEGRDKPAYHAQSVEEVLGHFSVQLETGLNEQEVESRRDRHGANRLKEAERRGALHILFDQFKSIVVIILAAAGILAFAFGRWAEGIAIMAVILVNAAIGFVSEWKARRSMEALREMGQPHARVRRDGEEKDVAIEELVPGDVALLGPENIVPADMRLAEARNLRVEEASLTGESVPVNKRVRPAPDDAPLAERDSMLYKGTTVAEGEAVAVVVATGMETELGRISELAAGAEERETPLQQRLNSLGRRLAYITLAIAAVVCVVGLLAGQPTMLMIETAIALGVAAIPEGLPIVATIALARGMWIMAKRNALINRLTAVETLGATRIIFTDKTGTLTQNRMTLRRVVTPSGDHDLKEGDGQEDDPLLQRILEVGVLCNNAALSGGNDGAIEENEEGEPRTEQGDPTEVALLAAGVEHDLRRNQLLERKPEVREVSFDPDVMMMATFHQTDGGLDVAVKGAPRAVLEVCTTVAGAGGADDSPMDEDARRHWEDRSNTLAREGLRLLAMAEKRVENQDAEPYEHLRFLGLVGLFDPPRSDVQKAIDECQAAGIRVIMVTGDQPQTGRAIGKQVGLVEEDDPSVIHGGDLRDPGELSREDRERVLRTNVFARVTPEQKLNLVKIYQDNGETVAMTGDGVNDAPALKQADIGVAMGERGTDAARQVSDMVLKDDKFQSIVAAVKEGRIIFSNIRKSTMFMLCTNVAEVLAVAIASVAGIPLPLRPLQILYLNVLTDVFPALALGVGEGDERVMQRKPRSREESVLTRRHWAAIGGWSGLVGACVLSGMLLGLHWLGLDQAAAVTISFMTLAFAKLWFVFNLRDRGTTMFSNDVVRNPWIWGAIALCAALLLAAVYLPGLSNVLETRHLGIKGWGLVLALSLVPLIVGQVIHAFRKPSEPQSDDST